MNDPKVEKRSCTYIIMGVPIAWARPGRARHGMAYDTQKSEKTEYGWHLKAEHGADELFSGAVHMDVVFFMPITRSAAQNKIKFERDGKPHIFVPDLSNLIKFIEDAASNDILYHDDCIIASISARKVWDLVPRTELTLRQL